MTGKYEVTGRLLSVGTDGYSEDALKAVVADWNNRSTEGRLGQYLTKHIPEKAIRHLDRISHRVTELTFRESEQAVYVTFEILDTIAGGELRDRLLENKHDIRLTTVKSGDKLDPSSLLVHRFDFIEN